jgi:AcrR family transcriptional regulator
MAAPRKDNVKGKILDAAEALLQTKNLSDISLAEIAALAGVSKGTLYYHYKNKTDILFDITDRYLSKQWDELVSWTENREKGHLHAPAGEIRGGAQTWPRPISVCIF